MGSGGSKEETNTTRTNQTQKNTSNSSRNGTIQRENAKQSWSPQKLTTHNNVPKKSQNVVQYDSDGDSDEDLNSKSTGNNNYRTTYDNSNKTETDNNTYNNRVSAPVSQDRTDYPETYAQRNQRAQYTNQQFIRQKTIYRDPDEWEVDDETSVGSFDVSKFKKANKQVETKKEIFAMTPDYTSRPLVNKQSDNIYDTPTLQKQKSVPKYDISEEELMADIEKEYLY